MSPKTHLCTLNLAAECHSSARLVECDKFSIHYRLARACALLEQIEWQRSACRSPALATLLEQRIIWRELLDLELQNLDDQIKRVLNSVGGNSKTSEVERQLVALGNTETIKRPQ